MSDRYPVEALLRPPVELYSAVVATSSGLLALWTPSVFMLTPRLAQAVAIGLFGLALVRLRMGFRVVRYQRNLRRLPHYELPATQIPISTTRLFLGKGFQWTHRHTQRLRDTLRPEVQRYLGPGWVNRLACLIEGHLGEAYGLRRVARAMGSRPLSAVGGRSALHGVGETEQSVFVPLGERVGHMLVLGTTRVGKTRLGEILITQDTRCVRNSYPRYGCSRSIRRGDLSFPYVFLAL